MFKTAYIAKGEGGEFYISDTFSGLISEIEDNCGEMVGNKKFYKAESFKEIKLSYKEEKDSE